MSYGLPSEGTRRLQLALGWLAAIGCLVALVVTVTLHGPPFWIGWWVVMAVVLVATFFVGRLLTPVFEWIIAGYRSQP
jgi:hypothetical protein